MAKKINKTSEQMRQETIDAMELFEKNLKEFLRNGDYEIKFINRHYSTQEIESIELDLDGTRLYIERDDLEFDIHVFAKIEDLINPEVIKFYNKITIDRDIKYYEEKLKKLKAQKTNFDKEKPQDTDEENMLS